MHMTQTIRLRANRPSPVSGRAFLVSPHSPRSQRSTFLARSDAGDAITSTNRVQQQLKDVVLTSTSGLDRGLDAAGVDVANSIEQAITDLCAASPAPRLDLNVDALDGTWSLLYSSEFVPGNTKFAGNWPLLANSDTLRQFTKPLLPRIANVEQSIDVSSKRLNNIVTLELRPPVFAGLLSEELGPAPIVVARLEHDYYISGAATLTITFDKTTFNTGGGINGWFGSLPELSLGGVPDNVILGEIRKVTEAYRSSSFDVIYLDETMRITKADRGEYRVFTK